MNNCPISVVSVTPRGGLYYHSVQLPNGTIITGHSRCCAGLRHYSKGIIPTVNPLVIYSDLTNSSTLSMISSSLKKVSGIYAFQLISSGEFVYVGSSVNLARRFAAHINGNTSNIILQRSFAKYGISAFNFVILEEYHYDWDLSTQENRDLLLALEQKYLDSLKPCYNIAKSSTAPFTGRAHSDTAKAAISSATAGPNNPNYGKTTPDAVKAAISKAMAGSNNPAYGRTGELHPMYGKAAANAQAVYLYSLSNELLNSFSSQTAAAEWLGVSNTTVSKCIRSGKALKNKYYVTNSPKGTPPEELKALIKALENKT